MITCPKTTCTCRIGYSNDAVLNSIINPYPSSRPVVSTTHSSSPISSFLRHLLFRGCSFTLWMADRRGIIIPLVILAFIFLSPDPARAPAAQADSRLRLRDVVAAEQRSLSELQNSTYLPQRFHQSDGPGLNLTGLELERGYAWRALPDVQTKAKQLLEYALGEHAAQAMELEQDVGADFALYGNVTGFVRGGWVRSTLEEHVSAPQLNLSRYATEGPFGETALAAFARNVSAQEGHIRLRPRERGTGKSTSRGGDVGNVTDIDVTMSLYEGASSREHELRLHGVYFPRAGQIVVTTTSDKFAGIFALPHFALSERMFDASRSFLNQSLSTTVQRQINNDLDRHNPWSSAADGAVESQFPAPECELIVYLQQLPPIVSPYSSTLLHFIERELRFPTGALLPSVPAVRFSMIAFSPDCGYILESKGQPDFAPDSGNHLVGQKVEVLQRSGRRHLLVFAIALAIQLALLIRQMREASTPSTRSKISLYAIALLGLGDGFITMALLLTSLFVTSVWTNLVATAFIAFVSASFFSMRFLLDIWTVQAPERQRRQREESQEDRRRQEVASAAAQRLHEFRLGREAVERRFAESARSGPPTTEGRLRAAGPTPPQPSDEQPGNASATLVPSTSPAQSTPAVTPISGNGLSSPATQGPTDTGATVVFMPSDQEGIEPTATTGAQDDTVATTASAGPSFGSMYTRFYLLLIATIFMSLNAASWPSLARRIYFTTIALMYLSFWVPQLHRNIQRNCRHALNWEYVIGQSVLRLIPFAYFYGYDNNILSAKKDYISLSLLATWLWVQVVLLASQELIGPRWFIKNSWAPPAYDYHPVLREDEEGSNMPIGFSQATTGSDSPVAERTSPVSRRGSSAKELKVSKGKRLFDCAICMQDLEVPVVDAGRQPTDATLAGGLLARRMYMVTPCRHIFHSACLEGWMKYRLQCPICRETLPPL